MNQFGRFSTTFGICILIAGSLSSTALAAGDLTEVFPGDTLLYIGRSGSEQTDAACRLTAFGKTLADPQVDKFTHDVWTAINVQLARQFPKKKGHQQHAALKRVLETLGRRPAAVALLDGGTGDHGPFVQAALVVQVGRDAPSFLDDVDMLFTIKGVPATQPTEQNSAVRRIMLPVPGGAYYGIVKDYFIFAIDERTIGKIKNQLTDRKTSLVKNESLVASRKKIGGNDRSRIMTVYVNVARGAELLKQELAHSKSSGGEKYFTGLFAVAQDLKSVCWEKHYRERGCFDAVYLHTPGKGSEWSLSSETKSLHPDDLSIIPKSPSWAMAGQVDLSALAARVLSFIESADADTHKEIMGAIKKLEDSLGFCIDEAILKNVGPVAMVYDAPENGGFLFSGITIVFESPDVKKIQESLRKIVGAIQKAVGEEPKVRVSSFEHHHHKVEFVNVAAPMPIAPAWSSHGKWVIVGLYPQVVTTALDRLTEGSRKESILDNPDVVAAKKTLGEFGSTFSYVDTRAAWEHLYPFALIFAQIGVGAAQSEGAKIDISSFPTQKELTQHLFADVGTTRVDPDGVLYASYGPLPVGTIPMFSSNIATTATLVSVLLPSLSRSRELSKRVVCAANLRGIGQAMYIHAQDDSDRFPPDFKTLIKENNTTPKQFVCPSSDAQLGDLDACYAYIPGQTTYDDPTNVLVYEKPGCHQNEGGNVLFQDSHVEFIKPYEKIERLVKETKERLAKKKKK